VHRLIAVEVKYRSFLAQYLERDAGSDCTELAQQQWLEAYMVLVTDDPDRGRSCFQAVDLQAYTPGTVPSPVDLHEVAALAIPRSTAKSHEHLLRAMFEAVRAEARKPAARMPGRTGALPVDVDAASSWMEARSTSS
jgi:hypothetical protein